MIRTKCNAQCTKKERGRADRLFSSLLEKVDKRCEVCKNRKQKTGRSENIAENFKNGIRPADI